MRSRMLWVVASAAAVSVFAACSSDDGEEPGPAILPSQPTAAGGSSGASPQVETPAPASAGSGGGSSEAAPPGPLTNGNDGAAAGTADAGSPPAPLADAGPVSPAPDAGPAPGNPPPGNPPPAGPVGFSDVFQLLVANCGNCHGATAGNGRPRFAQAGNEAASFTATQAAGNGGPVSGRIILRAVTLRDMPPACGRAALGTGACLDAGEAALLQAWLTQGAQR